MSRPTDVEANLRSKQELSSSNSSPIKENQDVLEVFLIFTLQTFMFTVMNQFQNQNRLLESASDSIINSESI